MEFGTRGIPERFAITSGSQGSNVVSERKTLGFF
jgi:hypothetical protein